MSFVITMYDEGGVWDYDYEPTDTATEILADLDFLRTCSFHGTHPIMIATMSCGCKHAWCWDMVLKFSQTLLDCDIWECPSCEILGVYIVSGTWQKGLALKDPL